MSEEGGVKRKEGGKRREKQGGGQSKEKRELGLVAVREYWPGRQGLGTTDRRRGSARD